MCTIYNNILLNILIYLISDTQEFYSISDEFFSFCKILYYLSGKDSSILRQEEPRFFTEATLSLAMLAFPRARKLAGRPYASTLVRAAKGGDGMGCARAASRRDARDRGCWRTG